ncbi:VOC family protein [Jeotgalibacillus proteolyticus]|uniref:Lactoylglutathione lyase n=1 Tax=Jeotgalibacillus proteolyticus TaxID=2082395 RepID=A0A2S5G816_9BACL|nr:VOC family protein [Jeotgalibacillus proteolyticus]PPA69118.1 lactoylglutathione lyase [Jeotgalibacillus proteolyticus]
MKKALDSNKIAQIGIIVRDIEKTSQAYADFFGIEKPKAVWTDGYEKAETVYKEKPSNARAQLAFFDMGSVQLELIQPNEEPSTWKEYLDTHGEGVQHIAFITDKMKERVDAMQSEGISLIQKGEYTGGRYAYMDTTEDLKVIFELLENDK